MPLLQAQLSEERFRKYVVPLGAVVFGADFLV